MTKHDGTGERKTMQVQKTSDALIHWLFKLMELMVVLCMVAMVVMAGMVGTEGVVAMTMRLQSPLAKT